MLNSQRLPASRFQIVPFACTLVLSAGLICAGSIESFAQGPCEIMDPTGTPLNVRASPNGHIVGTLQNGVQVSVLDRAVDRKKQAWVYVGYPENQSPIGWVYRDFIACNSNGTASQSTERGAESVGWMKSSDVGCNTVNDELVCNAFDHYTDVYQRGGSCATYGVPFFDRPNGKPIGLLWGEAQIKLGEKSEDGRYTHIYVPPEHHKKDMGIMPYSLKALRECG
jgi:hypothetical protein